MTGAIQERCWVLDFRRDPAKMPWPTADLLERSAIHAFVRPVNHMVLAREDAVHARRDVGEPCSIAARYFGGAPSLETDIPQGSHYGRPVAVAFEQFDLESFAQP